ncbi:hypothetical protein [Telmatospirillum sp. J64-1]|uniref:hypothetical protein n=1 Tax=Telmatospirillum sp. J64-1 TaxID=2502183 RepID=UPI00115F585B|nr:hypothetical protein [Telmatospirillum sp. J64-1]
MDPALSPKPRFGATPDEWHVPLSAGQVTLAEAVADLRLVGGGQAEVPLLVQLVENPKFRIPGFDLFHGRVGLDDHDCIHVLLGRGIRPKDEAFVIGFTMGSTHRVGSSEERLFSFIAGNLYSGIYRFSNEDIAVFRDALRLGYISRCQALDQVDFRPYMNRSLAEARAALGIEADLLRAYYAIEGRRYPSSPESVRLTA